MKLKGVVTIVPTPLKSDESFDVLGCKNIAKFLTDKNLPMFCLGSAGEGMNLPFKTRIEFALNFLENVNNKQPVLMGAGGFGVKDCLNFIQELDPKKTFGVHVIPYDSKLSDNGLEFFYSSLADKSPIPIWLYQNTTRHRGIPLKLAEKLSKHPNIHGMKLAGFDLRLNQRFIKLDSPDFQVFGSADIQMYTFFCLGLKASSSSMAACFPDLFILLHKSIMSGKLELASKINQKIMNFIGQLPKGAYADNGESSAEVKYLLSRMNICQEYVAEPFRTQNDIEKKNAESVFKSYENFVKEISSQVNNIS